MADAEPENSQSIIEGAGMWVMKMPTLRQRVFAVKRARKSGSVELVAPRPAERATYYWQYSIDEMKTWISLNETVKSSTTADGFVPGTTVYFRHRVRTGKGMGDWSDPVSLLIG
jgi:hypothetical protein